MQPYRVAIIGTGASVGNHVEAVRSVGERAAIVAAVDANEARVRAFAERHSVPRWYTNAAEMLSTVQPDLVHIVTPPATHFPLICESLEAGAWIYCEKPLCLSLSEFDQIDRMQARTGRYVSTVAQWRFGSAAQHLKRLMAAGEIGRPLVGTCHTLWYRTPAYYNVAWRGKWATEGGGPSITLGIHLMDLFLWLMGNWAAVQAMTGTLDRQIEVEDVSMALIRFENGALGNIVNSALSPRQETRLRLDFQRATVELSALYRAGNVNWRYSLPDGSTDQEALARWQAIKGDITGMHGVQLAAILDSMDRHERPPVSGSEARRVVEFIASLYKSAMTGQTVLRGSIQSGDPFYEAMNGVPSTLRL